MRDSPEPVRPRVCSRLVLFKTPRTRAWRDTRRHARRVVALAALAACGAAAQAADATAAQQVEVIGTSPLPGLGIDRDLLPYGTQVVRRAGASTPRSRQHRPTC